MNEGEQYKLNLFPLKDGYIFSRERIAEGLDNLRKEYGQFGYINFTAVPDTRFEDKNTLISPRHRGGRGQTIQCQEFQCSRIAGIYRRRVIEGLSDRPNLQFKNFRALPI